MVSIGGRGLTERQHPTYTQSAAVSTMLRPTGTFTSEGNPATTANATCAAGTGNFSGCCSPIAVLCLAKLQVSLHTTSILSRISKREPDTQPPAAREAAMATSLNPQGSRDTNEMSQPGVLRTSQCVISASRLPHFIYMRQDLQKAKCPSTKWLRCMQHIMSEDLRHCDVHASQDTCTVT